MWTVPQIKQYIAILTNDNDGLGTLLYINSEFFMVFENKIKFLQLSLCLKLKIFLLVCDMQYHGNGQLCKWYTCLKLYALNFRFSVQFIMRHFFLKHKI